MYLYKLFYHVEIFRKKVFGGCKSQIFFIEDQNESMEMEWWRLGDIARGSETVSMCLEVILQIWRIGGHFCGAHGASAPPPSACWKISKNVFCSIRM